MNNHLISHLRSTRALLLALAVAGALTGFLVVSQQHASATATNYCVGWQPTGGECIGPTHNLTANIVWDDTGGNSWVCEIAIDGNGNGVGGWGCGHGIAETCYGGNQSLRGMIYNGSNYWLYMNGTEYYSQGCP